MWWIVVAAALLALGVTLYRRLASIRAVAPELRSWRDLRPFSIGSQPELVRVRKLFATSIEPLPGSDSEPRMADGVPVFVHQPTERRTNPRGGLVWMHGGGFVMGTAAADYERCSRLAQELGVVVVNVDYRIAPEHPYPAALDDCYTALAWLHKSAPELGVDGARIAVGGASAGGGLAAAVAQLAHDRGEVPVAFQLLAYPMIDDRTALSRPDPPVGRLLWTARSNRFAWTAYLGRRPRLSDAPPYAAAARREDLGGIPPAWIGVGDLDLFCNEGIAYARRLTDAGVPVELLVQPRMQHAADRTYPDVPSMQRFRASMIEALRAAIA